MKIHIFILLLLVTSSVLFSVHASAEDESKEVMYVRISKGLVVNYGEPSIGRLRYLKVAVDVRVGTGEEAELVELHMPALKDSLILLLSAQEETSIRTGDGKEAVRLEALSNYKKIMTEETGLPIIQDLLFGSFIVQR